MFCKQLMLLLLPLLALVLLLFGVEMVDCKNELDDGAAVTALAGRSLRDVLMLLEWCVGDLLGERERLLSLELERIFEDDDPRRLPLELRELERDRDSDLETCLL